MYLSAYNCAQTSCVSIALLTYSFSTTCSDTSMAWVYSWYQFLLCPPFSSSRFLHIYTYIRTSFSGPRRCVSGFRLSSFDARGPESLWVGVGGFVYTHLCGPVPRFWGTLFLTWDPKSGWLGGVGAAEAVRAFLPVLVADITVAETALRAAARRAWKYVQKS